MTNKYSEAICFIFIFFFSILFLENLNGIVNTTTRLDQQYGYIDISQNWFQSEAIIYRPLGYPIFIFLIKSIFNQHWLNAIVIIQIIFYAFASTNFYAITTYIFPKNYFLCIVITLICFISPQAIVATTYILPESLPTFFIIYLIKRIVNCIFNNNIKYSEVLKISTSAFIAYTLKPVWLIIPIIILFCLCIIFCINKSKKIISLLLLFLTTYSILFFLYTGFIKYQMPNADLTSKIKNRNLNLALVRLGAFEGTEDTKLYQHYEKIGIINKLRLRTWDNSINEYAQFSQLKSEATSIITTDEFWKKSLSKVVNIKKFVIMQIMRFPKFFSTSGENSEIILKPNLLNQFYQSCYSNIHKRFSFIILFNALFIFNIHFISNYKIFRQNEKIRSTILFLFLIVIGTGMLTTFLTYQNSSFLRMRATIEPIILFLLSYPIYIVINKFGRFINKD